MTTRAARCQHCSSALADGDQILNARYDKVEVPEVEPVVTRVEGEVVIQVIRASRGAGVEAEVMDGHRPVVWISDLYDPHAGPRGELASGPGAPVARLPVRHRRGRHGVRAKDAGPAAAGGGAGAPEPQTGGEHRKAYLSRLDSDLNKVIVPQLEQKDGRRMRRRYIKVRGHLFTFMAHPEVTADNNGTGRELRPTASYRKVTGGFRSDWGVDLFAAVSSVIGTAKRQGNGAYQAIRGTLHGQAALGAG